MNNKNQIAKALPELELQFCKLVQDGIDCWKKAGEILVQMKAADPEIFDRLSESHSFLTREVLEGFERIGLGQIYAPLLADTSAGANMLLKCPYDVQEKYYREPIDVAVEWTTGKISSVKKRISRLSKREVRMVFSHDGSINNLEQQAFRLKHAAPKNNDDSNSKTVDVGYYSLTVNPNGEVEVKKCAKNAIAQPVRVVQVDGGYKTSVIVFYKMKSERVFDELTLK